MGDEFGSDLAARGHGFGKVLDAIEDGFERCARKGWPEGLYGPLSLRRSVALRVGLPELGKAFGFGLLKGRGEGGIGFSRYIPSSNIYRFIFYTRGIPWNFRGISILFPWNFRGNFLGFSLEFPLSILGQLVSLLLLKSFEGCQLHSQHLHDPGHLLSGQVEGNQFLE